MHLVHHDRNYIYNFGIMKEKVSLKFGGGLIQCYIHAPIMSSQEKLLFKFFMLDFLIVGVKTGGSWVGGPELCV